MATWRCLESDRGSPPVTLTGAEGMGAQTGQSRGPRETKMGPAAHPPKLCCTCDSAVPTSEMVASPTISPRKNGSAR